MIEILNIEFLVIYNDKLILGKIIIIRIEICNNFNTIWMREKERRTVQQLEGLSAFVEYLESERWLGNRFVSGQAFPTTSIMYEQVQMR